ncbi:hypothetical protein ZHAS_00016935 [Anopheles sinensis]|uniref:Uncharacterized protein n=1 Tax=Anopheles sinensis TaxID=74873 RepID=A0A084WFE2_ANOSI|nr:hypothetical protein ZHAS_00016935 [Anopheles sinensis]
MVPFQLEILALVAVLIGFTVNTYIVVIVILTKQVSGSKAAGFSTRLPASPAIDGNRF